ncbi:MAG: Enoyl-CoA hydratase [Labilithrix sp.]|nr:Enoyl-CoA hydratase [Labilithrix sp.]
MLHVERHGSVLLLVIDRPDAKNALDHATFAELTAAVAQAGADRSVRAAVLTSAGDVFVSGGDLREMRGKESAEDAARFSDLGFDLFAAIAELPFPVLCALPGRAIGGGAELALACDLRIADRHARISLKQVRMGVTTAWGTVPRLVAAVGAGAAARLLYTGQDLDAPEAKRLGLYDEVTEPGESRAVALRWADDIAKASPTAVAAMKRLLRESLASARDVRSVERASFVRTWSGADHHEAVEAYFARRPPVWADRES